MSGILAIIALAAVLGLLLGIAAVALRVERDPLVEKINALLSDAPALPAAQGDSLARRKGLTATNPNPDGSGSGKRPLPPRLRG